MLDADRCLAHNVVSVVESIVLNMFSRFVPIIAKLKALKKHGRLMLHAFRHPDTPKWIKGFMLAVVAYLLSPIDMIPDFALILGLTDDVVVITAAMWFLGQMIPITVRDDFEVNQGSQNQKQPSQRSGSQTTQPKPVSKPASDPSQISGTNISLALIGLTLLAFIAFQAGGWDWLVGVVQQTKP